MSYTQIVSLATAPTSGQAEIFLQDGGREILVQNLLEDHIVITGSPCFDIFNGDVQLAFSSVGAFASVREQKHSTGYSGYP